MTTDATAPAAGGTESEAESIPSASDSGPWDEHTAPVAAAIHEAAAVKQRELDEAIGKLERGGDLTAEDRAAVESLADALVGELLAVLVGRLSPGSDRETLETTLRLFGHDEPAEGAAECSDGDASTGGDSQ